MGYVPYAGQVFLPQFCDQQSGVDNIDTPFLALSGGADTTAPIKLMDSAERRMKGSRYLVELAGVPHEFKAEYAGDVLTWTVTFLRAYMHLPTPDGSSPMDAIVRMKSVVGGRMTACASTCTFRKRRTQGRHIRWRSNTTTPSTTTSSRRTRRRSRFIDNGTAGPGWVRTGQSFYVSQHAPGGIDSGVPLLWRRAEFALLHGRGRRGAIS